MNRRIGTALLAAALLALGAQSASAQGAVPHPREFYGFEPGADYKLAGYPEFLKYFAALDAASDRVKVFEIGKSVLGKPMLLVAISSEDNIRQLDRYKQISQRLAKAKDLSEAEARQLAKDGKTIVWIDGGIHATEVGGAQHTPLLAHQVVTTETEEMKRIRDDVILLLMPAMNPDGLDIVVDWYRSNVGTPFETSNLPILYHFYTGHDNNRDFAMIQQPETKAISRALYEEWFPQILYNHHQSGPFPARIEIPPFDDPVNPTIHPLIVKSVNLVGAHMAKRFEEEAKPGVVQHREYDMWRADGMRYPTYGHNMVSVHSETALYRYATPFTYNPDSLPKQFSATRGSILSAVEPSIFYSNPWRGGLWRIRDAMDYMLTGDVAVLDIAARLKQDWLFNMYRLGRIAIERGQAGGPFAYIIPADQWDSWEAGELVNVLRRGGADVNRATAPFVADGKSYPAGSFVIPAAQYARGYLQLLLEKNVYPDKRLYPGGPPDPPYDVAGWTLPIAMGVQLTRIEKPFQAATTPVTWAAPTASAPATAANGYLLSRSSNASATALNRLLAAGERVSLAGSAFQSGSKQFPAGTAVVESGAGTAARVQTLARELGVEFSAAASRQPAAQLRALHKPRVGLYKSWVANMDEGWTRWLLEKQYEFTVDTLHDADIRAGDLNRYDAIVLPDQSTPQILSGHRAGSMPEKYVGGLGASGTAALKKFVEDGGTIVAMDEATDYAIKQFALPVRITTDGLENDEFFIPGSLIRMTVDPTDPIAYGMQEQTAAFFVNSRAFEVTDAARTDVIARYGKNDLLLSGWEIGAQKHLADKPAVVRADVGAGSVVLIGFRPQFRGYSRATLKLLFNAIYDAAADKPPATRPTS